MDNRSNEEWRRDVIEGLTARIDLHLGQFSQRIKELEVRNTKIQTQITEVKAAVARIENQYASYDTHIKYLCGALGVTFTVLVGYIWLSIPHINWQGLPVSEPSQTSQGLPSLDVPGGYTESRTHSHSPANISLKHGDKSQSHPVSR